MHRGGDGCEKPTQGRNFRAEGGAPTIHRKARCESFLEESNSKNSEQTCSTTPRWTTRIAVGKGIGLLFGLAGFIMLPYFLPEAGWLLRWGILLWYTTVGAVIGVFGVYTWHPILKLPMP